MTRAPTEKLREIFGIDSRSLGLFGIGLGLVLPLDLLVCLQDLTAFYTDEGFLLRYAVMEQYLYPAEFSVHLLNGSWGFQLGLFILAFIFGGALLIGYKIRLATLASWILLISL
jgi:hypothetical protein